MSQIMVVPDRNFDSFVEKSGFSLLPPLLGAGQARSEGRGC